MKKLFIGVILFMSVFAFFLLNSCAQDFECDIYQYSGGFWTYYTWDVYRGRDAAEAEANCEDDWASAYDCRNCEPY